MNRSRIVTILFLLSGFSGMIYELAWIRLFSLVFGQTSQALGTVLAVYLGGLALGAWWSGILLAKLSPRSERCLQLYGAAELITGGLALAVPVLLHAAQAVLRGFYSPGHDTAIAVLRPILCSAILLPPTVLMGASLPLLAAYTENQGGTLVRSLYTLNLLGATLGALAAGFALFPGLGFTHSLWLGCALNTAIGMAAISAAGHTDPAPSRQRNVVPHALNGETLATGTWTAVAIVTGAVCTLQEVVWGRVYGLLLGPTASTVALVLGVFLAGLTLGAIFGGRIRHNLRAWLCRAQFAACGLLLWAFLAAGDLPWRIADWVRAHDQSPEEIELMKLGVLLATLLPLALVIGISFPLMLQIAPERVLKPARRVGGVYGLNTTGCVAGALITSWWLIPTVGTQVSLLLGGSLSAAVGTLLLIQLRHRWWTPVPALVLFLVALAVPHWDINVMTAGDYKYAPYFDVRDASGLDRGQPVYLREGRAGVVAVRREGSSLVLSIDGKVDASDTGGDLLTEKLLAHLPLMLKPDARSVCLIGLASGVTAGAALTHSIESLDVAEISQEVVEASHFFDHVNRRPLADSRTSLLVNDGRNHLILSSRRYDAIISEPSNPWIAGMNSMFTQEFFQAVRSRLTEGGVFGQWFHIYNMPPDDLASLLRAFTNVFPRAILWQLNDGDVLLTGFFGGAPEMAGPKLPSEARADLRQAGVAEPDLLWNLYVMRDADIRRFAGNGAPNTDDRPELEFHGQRDLHAQTDLINARALVGFPKQVPDPVPVRVAHDGLTAVRLVSLGQMFERAESLHSAFRSYQAAWDRDRGSVQAAAGMDRTGRLPEERKAVQVGLEFSGGDDDLEHRTERALELARSGTPERARFLLEENAEAHPSDPAARMNYGLFCLERNQYSAALRQFEAAIGLDATYLPATEAMAETYLRLGDRPNALLWSRRVLELDPREESALKTVATLEGSVPH